MDAGFVITVLLPLVVIIMIKTIEVKNFQRHKVRRFDLSPGVNAFVGKSGAGKSAGVVRSLRWLAFNKPLGDSFRRWFSDSTYVKATFDDDSKLIRFKSDNDSYYSLTRDGVKEEFRSFGQFPPDVIAKFINLSSTLNFQFQHDKAFLLSSTPSELARTLNELIGLDKIDEIFSRIGAMLRRDRQQAQIQEATKKQLSEELNKYNTLALLDRLVKQAASYQKISFDGSDKMEELVDIRIKYEKLQLDIVNLASVNLLKKELDKLQARRDAISSKRKTLSSLVSISNKIIGVNTEIGILAPIQELDRRLNIISAKSRTIREQKTKLTDLIRARSKMSDLMTAINGTRIRLEDAKQEFKESFPDICPLCGKAKEQ